jgi:hypothetical protein
MLQAKITDLTPSALASLLKEEISFNLWANKRLVNWLSEKTSTSMEYPHLVQLIAPLESILRAERYWYDRLCGRLSPLKTSEDSLDQLFEKVLTVSSCFSNFIKALSDYSFYEEHLLHSTGKEPALLPVYEIVQHALLYSAMQRGQLLNIASTLEWNDAPPIDYLSFLLVNEMDMSIER